MNFPKSFTSSHTDSYAAAIAAAVDTWLHMQDEPTSWSQDQPYFPFSYFLHDGTPGKNPCPGTGESGHSTGASSIDTWCPLELRDEDFYDYTLANNTIERLQYASVTPPPIASAGSLHTKYPARHFCTSGGVFTCWHPLTWCHW